MTPSSAPPASNVPNIVSASIPETLATLGVNPDTGLTPAEVEARRQQHGYNEVAEEKSHPVRQFLKKFWGVSAWMLELIMLLSAVLRKFSDLVVVGALLVVNALLSFMQEQRAAIEDGRIPIDTNLVENAIRPFALGRRNWLFSATPKGATASARLFSLIETAKANRIEPY